MPQRESEKWLWLATAGFQRIGTEGTTGNPHFVKRVAWEPKVDVLEQEFELLVLVELPGMEPREIQLEFDVPTHQMIVRGRRNVPEESCGRPHQLEIYYGEFERRIQLPEVSLDLENAKAELRDGILRISMLKERSSPQV